MDDQDSQRFIGDITVELTEISGSINKILPVVSEKQFYDKDLAGTIKKVIETAVGRILENKSFDENLGETIMVAITEAASRIADIKVDVSPVMKIGLQMVSQVKEMITAFTNMPKAETNDEKYQGMITVMMGVIQKNNELMQMVIEKQNQPLPAQREIAGWTMNHFSDNGRIKKTDIIANYKSNL